MHYGNGHYFKQSRYVCKTKNNKKKTKFILWIGVVSILGVVPRAGGTLQLIVFTLV